MQKSVLFSAVAFVVLSFAVAVAQEPGQESEQPASTPVVTATVAEERVVIETKDKEGPANKGLQLDREVRPRLPNGFAAVVDAAQKEKIYDIQKEYNELIALLKLRIELLEKERDVKVDAVLSPSQLEKVRTPARRTTILSR